MEPPALTVSKTGVRLTADPKRVIARLFVPGGASRVNAVVDRVQGLSDDDVLRVLDRVLERYAARHKNIHSLFDRHYDCVVGRLNGHAVPSPPRRRLIGAYFTCEYSLESVALFNPSIVVHPDQTGMGEGRIRFVLSLRACGEGHISSIEFRSGVLDASGWVSFDPLSAHVASQTPVDDHVHDKVRFFLKLKEMGAYHPLAERVIRRLPDEFTIEELTHVLDSIPKKHQDADTFRELSHAMLWLAHSSYRLEFPRDSALAERVIFPVTENESRGIEDARFVRFLHDDGRVVYYATFTAYNGVGNLPQFMETTDFLHFKINTLNGRCVQNKGMALFPRKIADRYVMISRLDGENLYLLRSDDIHFWNEGQKIHAPVHPWEFIQIGNCGSPLETSEGWVLLTHGVGPMREYWIGALLLDRDDPSRVIGHLKQPVLMPTEEERDGYVPNVVYSCGGMIHRGELIIPYGICDTSTGIARIALDELLARLVSR